MSNKNRLSISIGSAVGLVAVAVALAAYVLSYPGAMPDRGEPLQRRSSAFQLSPTQWASLRIDAVRAAPFDLVLRADGLIAAGDDASVAVYSSFTGRVTSVHAQLGQAVHRGERLASVLAMESAQGNADLASAVAAEAIGRRQLGLAKAAEDRQHELFLEEAGAEKDWLQSRLDLATAENNLRAQQAALSAARDKASILGIDASKVAADAGQASIVSPIDGVVVQRQVAAGQVVSSLASGGSGALFTIADLRKVIVAASTGEVEAGQLRVGQPIEISAPALPVQRLHARISWVGAVVDPATHRVAFRAELPNPGAALKPQMSVAVRVLDSTPTKAAAIPSGAVVFEGEQAHCYVVVGERRLAARPLQLGRLQDGLFEVLSGLSPNERVVTHGALFIDHAGNDSP